MIMDEDLIYRWKLAVGNYSKPLREVYKLSEYSTEEKLVRLG